MSIDFSTIEGAEHVARETGFTRLRVFTFEYKLDLRGSVTAYASSWHAFSANNVEYGNAHVGFLRKELADRCTPSTCVDASYYMLLCASESDRVPTKLVAEFNTFLDNNPDLIRPVRPHSEYGGGIGGYGPRHIYVPAVRK